MNEVQTAVPGVIEYLAANAEETVTPPATESTAAAGAQETEQQGTTTTESATGETQEQQLDGEQKPKGGFQKRIDKLTREKEFWKEQALASSRPGQQQQTQQPAQTETAKPEAGKPKAADFETHAEFVEALADWKVEQRMKAAETNQAQERARTQQQTAQQAYQAKEKEYASAVPDFDEVVASADFPVSKAVIDEIVHGDNGPALKYYLARNPDEAARLSKMTPVQLAREVGRLESKFQSTAAKPAAAKVTTAPPPPSPAGKSATTSTKDPGEMSPREYREWRAKTYPNLQ